MFRRNITAICIVDNAGRRLWRGQCPQIHTLLLFGFDAIPSLQEVCGGFHRRTLRCTKHRVASPDERVRLLALGADLRAAWDASTTSPRDKKELLRAVLEEVIVSVQKQERPAHLTLRWRGGALTDTTLDLPRLRPAIVRTSGTRSRSCDALPLTIQTQSSRAS